MKERTFGAYQAEGDPVSAAGIALDLARDYGFKQQHSIAAGWLHRAERLLEGRDETFVHGYLALCRSDAARLEGSINEALSVRRGGRGHRGPHRAIRTSGPAP